VQKKNNTVLYLVGITAVAGIAIYFTTRDEKI